MERQGLTCQTRRKRENSEEADISRRGLRERRKSRSEVKGGERKGQFLQAEKRKALGPETNGSVRAVRVKVRMKKEERRLGLKRMGKGDAS